MTSICKVIIHKPQGTKLSVTLPDQIPLCRLIPALVHKLCLPEFNERGELLKYHLAYLNSGKQIPAKRTLQEARVLDGTDLLLQTRANVSVKRQPPIRIKVGPVKQVPQQAAPIQPLIHPISLHRPRSWQQSLVRLIIMLLVLSMTFGCLYALLSLVKQSSDLISNGIWYGNHILLALALCHDRLYFPNYLCCENGFRHVRICAIYQATPNILKA